MNSLFSEKWDEIKLLGHKAGRFRVCPDHMLDLFIGFSITGEREFRLECLASGFEENEIPAFENISINLDDSESTHSLTMQLIDNELTDLFSIICTDLADASSKAETSEGAIRIFVLRLNRWAELMRRRRTQELSFKERLGLLGELSMLVWLIDNCDVEATLAVRGWRGPEGDTNDIGLNNVRIEVKAQLSTQRQALKISSLDQLDWDGRNLFITVNRFSPANDGTSLSKLVDILIHKLGYHNIGLMNFQRKLLIANYDYDADYINESFKLEELRVYQVSEDFPRLVPGNVPLGITKVNYEVASEALLDFQITQSELESLIND